MYDLKCAGLQAPDHRGVEEPEEAGTISGVQGLHTKDSQGEEAIQLPHSRAASFGGVRSTPLCP